MAASFATRIPSPRAAILPNDGHRTDLRRHGTLLQRANRHDQDAAAENASRAGSDRRLEDRQDRNRDVQAGRAEGVLQGHHAEGDAGCVSPRPASHTLIRLDPSPGRKCKELTNLNLELQPRSSRHIHRIRVPQREIGEEQSRFRRRRTI